MAEALIHDHIIQLEHDPDGVAFDIGANCGNYTKMLAEKFKTVYAFEMNQANYHDIIQETKHLQNIIVVKKAIGDKTGESFYYDNAKNRGGHTISFAVANEKKWGHDPNRHTGVSMITIDDFVKENNITNLKFIKCDIEGGEDYIFNYGVETLKKWHPIIALETHSMVNTQELSRFFRDIGYNEFVHHKFPGITKMDINNHYIIKV